MITHVGRFIKEKSAIAGYFLMNGERDGGAPAAGRQSLVMMKSGFW